MLYVMNRTWGYFQFADDFYGDYGGHNFSETGYFPFIFFSKTEVALLLLIE